MPIEYGVCNCVRFGVVKKLEVEVYSTPPPLFTLRGKRELPLQEDDIRLIQKRGVFFDNGTGVGREISSVEIEVHVYNNLHLGSKKSHRG